MLRLGARTNRWLVKGGKEMARYPLKGSERHALQGAKAVGNADPAERLEVSVLLRRGNAEGLKERVKNLGNRGVAGRHLSRDEFDHQ